MIALSYAAVILALASNTFGVIDYGKSFSTGIGTGSWSMYVAGTTGDNAISLMRQNSIDGDNLNKALTFRVLLDITLSTSQYVQPSIEYVVSNKQLTYYYPSYVISPTKPKYFDIALDFSIEFLSDFEIQIGFIGKKLYQVKDGEQYIDNPAYVGQSFNDYLNAIEINPNIISINDIDTELNNLNGLKSIVLGSLSNDLTSGSMEYWRWAYTDGANMSQLDFFGFNLNFSFNADNVGEQNYNIGYNDGFIDGEEDGYTQGYDDGVAVGSVNNNVFSLINSAFKGITNLFSYEIAPNLSLGVLLLIPVSLGVLLFVIKLITA